MFSQYVSTRELSDELFWDKPDRTNFHFCLPGRVVIAFDTLPASPVNAVSKSLVCAVVIQSVQAGLMAVFVPPGAFVFVGTVEIDRLVIIPVLS